MFNALNAISALVRQDDRTLALKGIRRLSDLLRYALVASERESVTLADELRFTRDCLALQCLRYGDRLQVQIEGDSADVLGAGCTPLLLQPLVENALRHGLDRQAGRLDVRIAFMATGDSLCIRIVNPLIHGQTANPGGGTGLRNVQGACRSPMAIRRNCVQRRTETGSWSRSVCRWKPADSRWQHDDGKATGADCRRRGAGSYKPATCAGRSHGLGARGRMRRRCCSAGFPRHPPGRPCPARHSYASRSSRTCRGAACSIAYRLAPWNATWIQHASCECTAARWYAPIRLRGCTRGRVRLSYS